MNIAGLALFCFQVGFKRLGEFTMVVRKPSSLRKLCHRGPTGYIVRVSVAAFAVILLLLLCVRSLLGASSATENLSTSSLECGQVSCELVNGCVDHHGWLHVFHPPSATLDSMVSRLSSFSVRRLQHRTYLAKGFKQKIPQNALQKKKAILMERYEKNNCGHVLGDEVWSSFRLTMLHADERQRTDEIWLNFTRSERAKCDDMFNAIFPSVIHRDEHFKQLCYEKIVFGVKGISYADGYELETQSYLTSKSFASDMLRFRKKFYAYANLRTPLQQPDTIVIMVKKEGLHMVNIDNVDLLISAVASELPGFRVLPISWSDFGLQEQVQLLSRTKLLISLPGSDIMNGIFLPNNSHMLIYCRYVHGTEEKSNEVALWFRHLHYIHTTEVCDKDSRPLDNGNVWVNVSRAQSVAKHLLQGL